MSRIEHLARTYWFDLLIALVAILAIVDVVLGRVARPELRQRRCGSAFPLS